MRTASDAIEARATIALAVKGKQMCGLIWDVIHEIEMPNSTRNMLSGQRYFLALEHLEGTLRLFESQIFAPAFALLRPLTESFIKGAWLHLSATDIEVIRFQKNGKTPHLSKLISDVEQTEIFSGGTLSRAHTANWNLLCGLTHGGPEAERLCYYEGAIGRTIPDGHGQEAVNYAASMGVMAAMGVAVLADCSESASKLLAIGKENIPL
ncbi:MAG TPA: hypothetical protein PKA59_12460 [Chakrabartia sp.]|jgi:hypothetical protein|nr:hypothetical protein [Chakrabartia sp.]